MKTLAPMLVWVVMLSPTVPAQATDTVKTPQDIEKLAKELVLKLGSSKFREREAAEQELAKLGIGAFKAIKEGLESPDPEIVARCTSLLPTIRMLDLKRRLEELAGDKEGRIVNTLPLGDTYEKICGKDENARKFYVELCKNNLQLLDDFANNPKMTGEAFNELTKGVLTSEMEGVALLLIAADEKIGPSIDEANRKQPKGGDRNYGRLISILWTPKYEALLMDANNGRYFQKLLFAWARRVPEPLTTTSFLFYIKDKLEKKVLNLNSGSDTLEFLMDLAVSSSLGRIEYHRGEAMSLLVGAGISNDEKIAFFEEKLLKDETVFVSGATFDVKGAPKIKVETRVCDYALAICVKLSGQSFQDYGFDVLGPYGAQHMSWLYSGFTEEETRKAAFKKYAEWRKTNPIKKDQPK